MSPFEEHTMNSPDQIECLSDYEILAELDSEGPAHVYQARQRSLDRIVTLYLVASSEFVSEEEAKRFLHGARVAAQLDHPAIARCMMSELEMV